MRAQESDRTERQGLGWVTVRGETAGFAVREQTSSDYGIDAIAELVDDETATGQLVAIQIKSGSSYLGETKNGCYIYRPDAQHVDYWLGHTLPVIVCHCDPENEIVYWERVANDTLESTGKGYKLAVPRARQFGKEAREALKDLVTPRVASSDYTLVSTEDVSHGMAKRYSIKVILNRPMTKPELAAVIRDMTTKTAKRRYSRNAMVKGRWGEADAHVVWIFIYASAADEKKVNYTCRSLWIDPSLDGKYTPSPLGGEDVGDGIIVDWTQSPMAGLSVNGHDDFDKEHYLDLIDPIIALVIGSLADIGQSLKKWQSGASIEANFLSETKPARQQISDAYDAHVSSPEPPYECHDLDEPVGSMLAYAQNIVIYHNERGIELWVAQIRRQMTGSALEDANAWLKRIKYEREKVS
ncbi:DUF4365 domain-containing protein [Halomonas citrativorans]|uniref:DUF4365 domain-containing protein n=1 Tax=Halomonas citrativorans TaxID=2742612 RepID=UPI0015942FE3|nr:DUF4365 domain-containing protein [Halomonas citrativorans]